MVKKVVRWWRTWSREPDHYSQAMMRALGGEK